MKIQSLLVVSIIALFCNAAFAEDTAAVTGICKDGTPYMGKSKRGACRGHDGVREWYGDKAAPAASTVAAPVAAPAPTAAPAPAAQPSAAATGICKDGTPYTGKSKRGGCRGHGGIKEWFADQAAPAASTVAPAVAAPAQATQPTAAATGICNDGTEYAGKSKRGACRGHKGVKEWFADKTAAPAPEPAAPTPAQAAPVAAPSAAPAAPAVTAQPSAPPAAAAPMPAPAAGSGKVWVNKKSKIYHCEGSKFYGHTKVGEYLDEADAQAQGYRPNRKKVCR